MRRFEFVGGTSQKFWEITQAGADVTVRFGRLGASGQSQTKSFESDRAAAAHAAKLIDEKVAKGYVEVSADGLQGGQGTSAAPADLIEKLRIAAPVVGRTWLGVCCPPCDSRACKRTTTNCVLAQPSSVAIPICRWKCNGRAGLGPPEQAPRGPCDSSSRST